MKMSHFKRFLSALLVFAMLLSLAPSLSAASREDAGIRWKKTDQQVTINRSDRLSNIQLDEMFAPTDIVRVSIVLKEKSTIQAGFSTLDIASDAQAMAYNRNLQKKQENIEQTISRVVLNGDPLDVVWNLTLVGNIISANVPYGKISAIEKIDGVAGVVLENMYETNKTVENSVGVNQFSATGMTGSNVVWSNGYTGAGSRIAVIDTGTDIDHLSFDNGAFLYALEQNAAEKGVSFEEYVAGLNLLDAQEIADVLASLNIYERDNSLTAEDLYLTEKLAFAVNYVDGGDGRLVVDHDSDYQGNHGSHVAGISTANRYIPTADGYVDAVEAVKVSGVAPDAQLITMKVFGYNSVRDSDYMAAIEDAILLGCDSVNLSLGTSAPGFSFNDYYAELLHMMTETDTVVVGSAGNEGMWTAMTMFGVPYTDDVNFDALGSPGSYTNFLTVASVDNDGGLAYLFEVGDLKAMYYENAEYGNAPLTTIDYSVDGSGTAYEYIFVDGLGEASDYEGMDLTGKVVFCSRGVTNFADKANIAVSLGAVAVVVYNNTSGSFGMNLSGYLYTAPAVSITQEDADYIRSVSTQQTTEAGLVYYTGSMDIFSAPQAIFLNSQYYTMSTFSSWGVPGDLSIKPEITAPGGSIYSVYGSDMETYGHDVYGYMSGTSMAAPQVTGMVALLAQYMRETGLDEVVGLSPRVLAQSLLMSTAVPMKEQTSDSYYPVMQQGAGLARVDLAALANSFILVEGQEDGKVKAELGDDPERTGVYSFTFQLFNPTNEAQDYALNAHMFRQIAFDPGDAYGTPYGFTVQDTTTTALASNAYFTANGMTILDDALLNAYDINGDGATNAQDADYLLEVLLGNEETVFAETDVNGDGVTNTYDAHYLLALLESGSAVTVPAGGSVTVEVELVLTEEAKQELDAISADGYYVQGYVFAEQITEDEATATNHSIPVLAFYGNWSDPNMFDRGTYMEMMYGISDLIPYLYQVVGNGNALTIGYGDGGEYYFGGNPFTQDDAYMAERNAFNSLDASYLDSQYFTLLRGAGYGRIQIVDQQTGEVYHSEELGQLYPAYFSSSAGTWYSSQQGAELSWYGTDANGEPLPEGTVVEVVMTAVPEYYRNADGSYDLEALGHGTELVTQLTIDNTAPEMTGMELNESILTLNGVDNEYIAAAVLMNKAGTIQLGVVTPNQAEKGVSVSMEMDLTGVSGKTFLLAVYDYACNVTTYEIELDLPEVERPYFTVVDTQSGTYYGIDAEGNSTALAVSDREPAAAAEFVDGYVFEITMSGKLYVASDDDLNYFEYLCELDPTGEWAITSFVDMAYNYADGKLYAMFYSELNGEAAPALCTIDMFTGYMEVLAVMPMDVNNMAIDGEGNFYSVSWGYPSLYTYTLEDVYNGTATYIGEVGYYGTTYANSLAWDHNTDKLYWAFPNTLLEINTETAEPTLLNYFLYTMVGLYIRPETYTGETFAPVDEVTELTLNYEEVRVMVDSNVLLDAKAWPWNVSDNSVTWTSSDESIASVDEDGMVYGVSVGTAIITATSNLDPAVTASCVVEVVTLDKTLNALIWDTEGQIWWSEFAVNGLPNYIKLNETSVDVPLASATFTPDGLLYGATTDLSTGYLLSSLYTVDPETFELTHIGDSQYGYSDIAYAPHLNGGSILGTYGSSLLVVDPTTGEMYDYYQMFLYGLTAVTYAGSDRYQDYGFDTYIDWFFLIDTQGFVYLMGFLANENGEMFYLEHPSTSGGIFTVVNYTTEAIYYSSAHFDGEFLYWSVYNEEDNMNTLFAIDTTGNRKAYNLGNFGEGVWPVGGLLELNNPTAGISVETNRLAQPKAARDLNVELNKVAVSEKEAPATQVMPYDQIMDLLNTEEAAQNQQFTVHITPADLATNGMVQVNFDPANLALVNVEGFTAAFAYADKGTYVQLAFAETAALDPDAVVATLVFEILSDGDHVVTIEHTEVNNSYTSIVEEVTFHTHVEEIIPSQAADCTNSGWTEGVKCALCGEILVAQEEIPATGHSHEAVVTEPTCTEQGYTTYTCHCGDTYVADYVDALGHSHEITESQGATCTEDGFVTYTCHCGDTYTEVIPATGHNYEDGACTICGEPEIDNPPTGNMPLVAVVLAAMGAVTGAVMVIGKKRED